MKSLLVYGAALTFARGIPVIAIFAASWILAPDAFGRLAIFVTAVTTASLLADSGTDNASTWHASRSNGAERSRRLAALGVLRGSAAVVFTTALIMPQWGLWSTSDVGWSAAAALIAIAANTVAALNASRRVGLRIHGSGERSSLLLEKGVAGLLFIVTVPFLSGDLTSMLVAYSTSSLTGAAIAFRGVMRTRPSRFDVSSLMRVAAPFVLSSFCAAFVWRLPITVLGTTGGIADAGYLALMSYPVQLIASSAVLGSSLMLVRGGTLASARYRALLGGTGLGLFASFGLAGALIASDAFFPGMLFEREALAPGLALAASLPALLTNPLVSARLRTAGTVWSPTTAHVGGALLSAAMIAPLTTMSGAVGAALSIVASEYFVLLLLGVLVAITIRKRNA